MRAKDVMTRKVVTVDEEATIPEVVQLLLESRVSAVPVLNREGQVVGVVSEGDLVHRERTPQRSSWWLAFFRDREKMAEEFRKVHGLRARDVMTKPAVTAEEDASVEEIATLLEEKHIKRVPILKEGRLVGIVSRADLLRALAVKPPAKEPEVTRKDEEIRQAILDLLEQEPWAPLGMLSVSVRDGVVHLWGTVKMEAQKEAIRVAAENVEGVREVVNHLTIWEELPYISKL